MDNAIRLSNNQLQKLYDLQTFDKQIDSHFPLLKHRTDQQVFLDKFYLLATFTTLAYLSNFSLTDVHTKQIKRKGPENEVGQGKIIIKEKLLVRLQDKLSSDFCGGLAWKT